MDMPIRSFWALVGNIHKIEADEDRRALRIAVAAQSSPGITALMEEFDKRLADVVQVDRKAADAEIAKQGIAKLKDLQRRMG